MRALGIPDVFLESWSMRVSIWFTCANKVSHKGVLIGMLPSLIT